jgi:hypothetical protein
LLSIPGCKLYELALTWSFDTQRWRVFSSAAQEQAEIAELIQSIGVPQAAALHVPRFHTATRWIGND